MQLILFFSGQHRDPNVNLLDIVARKGFVIDEHFVTTRDGYVLLLHRVRRQCDLDDPNLNVAFVQVKYMIVL